MRPKGSPRRRGLEAAPARELKGRIGLSSRHFRVVQSSNQEVRRIGDSLSTDLVGSEQGVISSHKRILPAILRGF